MFKSNLTHTLYKHFISSHLNPTFTTELTTHSMPSFVYVDGVQIKLMAGYFKKNTVRPDPHHLEQTRSKELEIVLFEND